jgi:hypothetical protein
MSSDRRSLRKSDWREMTQPKEPIQAEQDAFAGNIEKYVEASENWLYDQESLWATLMADFIHAADSAYARGKAEGAAEVERLRRVAIEAADVIDFEGHSVGCVLYGTERPEIECDCYWQELVQALAALAPQEPKTEVTK